MLMEESSARYGSTTKTPILAAPARSGAPIGRRVDVGRNELNLLGTMF